MLIFHWKSVYLEPEDRLKTTPRPRQDRPLKKYRFLIENVDFSLEKCVFGTKKGVFHYVLRRKWPFWEKKIEKTLVKCVIQRRGRTAPVVGGVHVAEMLAREARS